MDKNTSKLKSTLENIWYYHKIHIFVAIFLVVIIGSCISDTIKTVDYDIEIYVMDTMMDSRTDDDLQNSISNAVYGKDKEVNVEVLPISTIVKGKTEDSNYVQKFMLALSNKQIDMIICDKESIEMLAEKNTIISLNDLVKDEYSENGVIEDDKLYGISAEGSNILNKFNIKADGKYIAISKNCESVDKGIEIIEYITSK